jgi:hypothetical protein
VGEGGVYSMVHGQYSENKSRSWWSGEGGGGRDQSVWYLSPPALKLKVITNKIQDVYTRTKIRKKNNNTSTETNAIKVHKQSIEPEFLDFQGTQESIPRGRFLQPM